ncbi:hypothetical protein D3C75_874660 [compost metagenome]
MPKVGLPAPTHSARTLDRRVKRVLQNAFTSAVSGATVFSSPVNWVVSVTFPVKVTKPLPWNVSKPNELSAGELSLLSGDSPSMKARTPVPDGLSSA